MIGRFCRQNLLRAGPDSTFIARRALERLTKQPDELFGVQVVLADNCSVQEQDGNIQAVAAHQVGIPVDIHYGHGGEPDFTIQGLERGHHLIAKVAVLPMDYGQFG